MDRYQAQRNVEPDLRSILFDTEHFVLLKTGCIAWDEEVTVHVGRITYTYSITILIVINHIVDMLK